MPAPILVITSNTVQPLRVTPQPPKGHGTIMDGNSFGRGQRAPDRGATQIEAHQLALVYVMRHREDRDNVDVIVSTLFIYHVPHFALIDISFTHSYIVSTVSVKLSIFLKCTVREFSVISPLGQSIRVNKVYKRVPLEI